MQITFQQFQNGGSDYDGDTLENDKELVWTHAYVNDPPFNEKWGWDLLSNPVRKDSDKDGVDDARDLLPMDSAFSYAWFELTENYNDPFQSAWMERKAGKSYNNADKSAKNYKDIYKKGKRTYLTSGGLALAGGLPLPQMAESMLHYLGESGTRLNFNVAKFLVNSLNGQDLFLNNYDSLMKYIEDVLKDGETLIIRTTNDKLRFTRYNGSNSNYSYSLGLAHAGIVAEVFKSGNIYTMKTKYYIYDYFDLIKKEAARFREYHIMTCLCCTSWVWQNAMRSLGIMK